MPRHGHAGQTPHKTGSKVALACCIFAFHLKSLSLSADISPTCYLQIYQINLKFCQERQQVHQVLEVHKKTGRRNHQKSIRLFLQSIKGSNTCTKKGSLNAATKASNFAITATKKWWSPSCRATWLCENKALSNSTTHL